MRSKAKRVIKQAKVDSWKKFVSNIKSPISSNSLWCSVKKMRGSPTNRIPILLTNNEYTTDPSGISNGLASYYLHKSLNSIPSSLPHIDPISFNSALSLPYNTPFSTQELTFSLNNSKRSAPGPDSIHLEMLQHLPCSMFDFLLSLYNHIWLHSSFPKEWLKATIIPIHKPGKPRSTPESYRPISLTNHLCKILERMVLNRLNWILEKENLLSPYQYGFRKYRSSMDHLASLDSDIRCALLQKKHTLLISLDLTSAFDMTDKNLILSRLMHFGLKGALPNFIFNFLQPRTLQVKINNTLSNPYTISLGVPQGSVLSPSLFNIAMSSLTEQIPPSIKFKIFADDIIIYTSSSISQSCTNTLQNSLQCLNSWASDNGLSFSPSKSTSIHFCKLNNCSKLNPLLLSNSTIPTSDSLKILGLTFDSRLSWKPHIKQLKDRSSSDLNLLRILSHSSWGADLPSLLTIYKSLIYSKLAYGDFIYDAASPSTKKQLDTIQNHSLRSISGAFRTSPIPSLQCTTSSPPLNICRQHSLLKFYSFSLFRPFSKLSLNLFNVHNPNYSSPKNSIPNRTSSLLSLHHILPPKYDYPLLSSFPPWLSNCPPIDLYMHSHKKTDLLHTQLNKMFLERISTLYPNYSLYYTDGSKTTKGVGASFISSSSIKMFKLPHYTSIFSAELLAIKEAIRHALIDKSSMSFLIITDSYSALSSIKSQKLEYNYIRQIMDLCYTAKLKHRTIAFFWIPSHTGIKGNDKADHHAKLAIERGTPVWGENHPKDFYSYLKHTFRSLFQLDWDLTPPENKLWSIKPLVFPPLNSLTMTRKDNVIMRRLAIGHTFATHSHLLKKRQAPICSCGSPLTVSHIIEDMHLKPIRDKHLLPSNLKLLIKSFDTKNTNLNNFLKEIDFIV